MVNGAHPWLLVGPWYRWPTAGLPSTGRASAPVIQKYETGEFVNEFLKNPQHSLAFLDSEDRVFEVTLRVPPLPLIGGRKQSLSHNVMNNTGIRKLFLDTHKRFYIVVCELHCDAAGFPMVNRDQACEAGFVIRRRSVEIPKSAEKPLRNAIREGGGKVQVLAQKLGVTLQLQGWIPSSFDRVGNWQAVEETPAVTNTETIHPLYPLVPDPRLAKHAGKGRNIYFGVIPTGSADTDDLGNARFDDRNLYEIRCFVRQHKFPCPKKDTRNDCHGALIWSRRTEQFQLASHFDLTGTSNRPVTIQMPDLLALEAQVANDPSLGRKAPVKMISPKASNLEASGIPPIPKPRGAAICSFSIPLITIVASFVFKLFLPIVVLAFQLWWMLALKFCIPPSFSLSADLAANLSAGIEPPEAEIDANLTSNFGNAAAAVNLEAQLSVGAQASFVANLSADFSADVPPDVPVDPPPTGSVAGPAANLPSITANLQFLPEAPLS
jgi:hypothetical protein